MSQTPFKDAYAILKRNADRLEHEELDVDGLMDVVEESIQAYKTCQTRLNAIENALKNAFNDVLTTETDHE